MTAANLPRRDVAELLKLIAATPGPTFAEMGYEQARAAVVAMVGMLDAPADTEVTAADHICNSASQPIATRSYTPAGASDAAPVIVFFHGGGWVTGDIHVYDSFCRFLARESGLRVLSVDYRRAPEAVFPAAYDDAVAATRWSITSEGPFNRAPAVILAGDSAGGNLAAAAARTLLLDGFPVHAQLLLYPVLDVSRHSASYEEFGKAFLLTSSDMDYFIASYVPDAAMRRDPRVSPLLAPNPVTAPPTVLLACGLDPLRDEARAYAARLAGAGVNLTLIEASGVIHGIATLRGALSSAEAELRRAIILTIQLAEANFEHD